MSDDPRAEAHASAAPPSASDPRGPRSIDRFLGEPTRDLVDWAWLWTEDVPFPRGGGRGLRGRCVALGKRLLRPFLRASLGDLFDRQRVFNLILLETLVKQQEEYRTRLIEHQAHLERLDARTIQGLQEVMRHNDALFSRVDQKLDRYRREAKDLWHRLGALIAARESVYEATRSSEAISSEAISAEAISSEATALKEQAYLALEERWRGAEDDIARRVSVHVDRLRGRGPLLDLGCGRGEALEVFRDAGLEARGIDSSAEMVAHCRAKGLDATEGDLFEVLAGLEPDSLGAIVSFHVVEHLPPETVPRLLRLAWRALAPGGVLLLETPSPLALAMSARDFWMDPTHNRPVHPAWLEVAYREAGFEPVSRVDLHPFPDEARLPEIDLAGLPDEQRELADQVNRLRDQLDDLLYGARDYAMVGIKP